MRLRHRVRLRIRAAVAIAGTAATMCGAIATISYEVVRTRLIDEREDAALRQAYANARIVRTRLRLPEPGLPEVLQDLEVNTAGAVLLSVSGERFAGSIESDWNDLPDAIRSLARRAVATQRTSIDGRPVLVVGVPVVEFDAVYFQVAPLDDIARTLSQLVSSLTLATAIAAIAAAGIGVGVSSAVLRPVRRVASVAGRIVDGDLASRLDDDGDPDLHELVRAFNEMVDALQERMQREAQFAADVAHEVRGPLMTFQAAVEVVNRRRAELPERAVQAVDALEEQVTVFNALVLDLLEISRFDAGSASLDLEQVDLLELCRATVRSEGLPSEVVRGDHVVVPADRRRMHQVIANLVQNAQRYAGGVTSVAVAGDGARCAILIDDCGPGVPVADRETIFDRFARGSASKRRGAPSGTGLGLALAREHVHLHGGRIGVEDSPCGGARFIVELPTVAP